MAARSQQMNLRCTFQEEECIRATTAAIDMDMSSFFELGLILATVDLKMLLIDPTPPRVRPGSWPFAPDRRDGDSAAARLTCNIDAHLYPTFQSAAFALHLSLPLFTIGSALRLAALEKAVNERRKDDKQLYNTALAKVSVPYNFEQILKETLR